MCVIIFSPCKGSRPSSKTLELCEKANPHGIGIVTQGSKEMFRVNKGVSLSFVKETLRSTGGAIAIHFRYATAGGIKKSLCHPFPCTEKAERWLEYESSDLLMTNGTWTDWEDNYKVISKLLNLPTLKGSLSDTRALSQIVAFSKSSRFLQNITDKHLSYKLVRSLHLQKNKTAKFYGKWSDFEGCLFSNLRWRVRPRKQETMQGDLASWKG